MFQPLTAVWRLTPRPFSDHQTIEPFTYRVWKWLWQQRSKVGWKADLFNRIQETEWDALVILDACRYDVLSNVADCGVIEPAVAPASATPGFLKQAKAADIFVDATYLSANPQTDPHPPGAETLVNLHETEWDPTLSTVQPDAIYEEAMRRLEDGDQVVAHTLQPHYPHICAFGEEIRPVRNGLHPAELDFVDDEYLEPQIFLSDGSVSLDRARRSYEICTDFAWERVKRFAMQATAEGYTVAITADHGELFGERGLVEHPVRVNVPALTTVPWIVFEPETKPPAYENKSGDVKERLAALGYIES